MYIFGYQIITQKTELLQRGQKLFIKEPRISCMIYSDHQNLIFLFPDPIQNHKKIWAAVVLFPFLSQCLSPFVLLFPSLLHHFGPCCI